MAGGRRFGCWVKSARDPAARQAARRRKLIDLRRQQLTTTHAAERMMLQAAHKAEQDRVFNRVNGRVFALFDRVPALRSVIAPLRRNLTINAVERWPIFRPARRSRSQWCCRSRKKSPSSPCRAIRCYRYHLVRLPKLLQETDARKLYRGNNDIRVPSFISLGPPTWLEQTLSDSFRARLPRELLHPFRAKAPDCQRS